MVDAKRCTHIKRCTWCGEDPLYQQYHDNEWGGALPR